MARQLVLLLVAGLLVGFAARSLGGSRAAPGPPERPLAPEDLAPGGALGLARCPSVVGLGELASIYVELGNLSATRRILEGDPVPWPTDLMPGLLPDAFDATLTRALDHVDIPMAVRSVDCSEYPCIGVVDAFDWSPNGAVSSKASDQVHRALVDDPDLPGVLTYNKSIAVFSETGQYHRAFVAPLQEMPAGHELFRLKLRLQQLANRHRASEGEGPP